MNIGEVNVEIKVNSKKVCEALEKIALILVPYDVLDKDIDAISESLISCLSASKRKVIE